MYSVQEKWIFVMIVFTSIIMLVFIKHTLSQRKHYILLFSLTFILVVFSFAFYWDMLIGPVYYPMVTNYWLKTLGLPNLLDYSPVLKDFIRNDLPSYFQEFRRFNGAGYIYVDRAHLENYGWENSQYPADFLKLHRLEGVNPRHYGYEIRAQMRAFLLPDLITTSKFMEDPNLYYKTYRLNKTLTYPFASFKDFNILQITHFSIGLSLACIIFVITLILTLLYALNFLTSLSLKDSEKLSPYECGFDPIHSNARIKFDVLYWIIGILYLIFDLEIIFIFPLATILHTLTNPIALFAYLFFMIILTLGFIYEWKKGALKLNL
jgi:NADH-quinone oxidoreductase subunit A